MFQIVVGNILDAKEDAICHQVNCMNVMGSGVAKAISTKWPVVKEKYHLCCKEVPASELLGCINTVELPDGEGPKEVINIFGQFGYGGSQLRTNYEALTTAFRTLNESYAGKSLAFPYLFGCGLANGDWATVESLMIKELKDCDVTIYRLSA